MAVKLIISLSVPGSVVHVLQFSEGVKEQNVSVTKMDLLHTPTLAHSHTRTHTPTHTLAHTHTLARAHTHTHTHPHQ